MAITDVVRGMDLIESTPRQIHVLDCLHRPAPRYGHLPVVLDDHGQKLSKSSGAMAINADQAPVTLQRALGYLNIRAELASPEQMLRAAV